MDVRAYYKRLREIESSIPDPFVVVVGIETPDGGKSGTTSEVTRAVAAKLITEARVRLASEKECQAFQEGEAEARREAEAFAATQRMQVMIVPNNDIRVKPSKGSKD